MTEERTMILNMLKEGQISIDEAERLLDALGEPAGTPPEHAPELYREPLKPRRFLVLVTNPQKPNNVNVRLPFSLVRAGLKIGKTVSRTGIQVGTDPNAQMAMDMLQRIDLDEILRDLNDGTIALPFTLVDVDTENGDRVQIILE